MTIRICRADEREEIFSIVNAAAEAYRGVIPADRWHEPYMSRAELDGELAAGVAFWGYDDGARLAGVMGLQHVRDVDLIRHAYVLPDKQGCGIGGALLRHLGALDTRPMLVGRMLVGTWAAGRSAFTSVTASRSFRRHARPRCSIRIGPSRSARSRPRSCWPIRRMSISRYAATAGSPARRQ